MNRSILDEIHALFGEVHAAFPDNDDLPLVSVRHGRSHRFVVQLPAVSPHTPHHLRPQEVTYTMSTSPVTFHDSDPAFTATFNPVDAKGQPTTPDTTPVWTTSDNTIINVTSQTPDGLSATVAIAGTEGTATLAVSTTDTNGTIVKATQDITVTAGEAVSGTITITPGIAAPTAAQAAEVAASQTAAAAPVDTTAPAASSTPAPADTTASTPASADAATPAATAPASVPSA